MSKNGLDHFFDAHQLGVKLHFDVDVKILLYLTSTASIDMKTAQRVGSLHEGQKERLHS